MARKRYSNIKFEGRKSPYNVQWIMLREDLSEDDAKEYIEKYKKSKATSLEGFISRHGEELGRIKFEEFQKTSVSRKLENFKDREEFKRVNREGSPRCPEYWVKRGLAKNSEEAGLLISEYQKRNSGVHKEYYISRNIDNYQDILNDINKRKTEKFSLLNYLTFVNLGTSYEEAYPILSLIKNPDNTTIENILNDVRYSDVSIDFLESYLNSDDKIDFIFSNLKCCKKSLKPFIDNCDKYWVYRTIVDAISWNNNIEMIEGYDLYINNESCYELDHKVSVGYGFYNNIPHEIIGSIYNLRFIKISDNRQKHLKNSMDIQELMRLIDENKKDI